MGKMKIIIASDYEHMSKITAQMIAKGIKNKHDLVLGLATGGTPIGAYKELIKLHKANGLDFSGVTSFNLDEYIGLAVTDKNSYNYFMRENLLKYININPNNVYVPKGDSENPEDFCRRYEDKIKKAGGIDLQLLGIGRDGHVAFNEPGSSFESRTRVVALSEQTIKDNSRFFDKEEYVPRFAITMGTGTILEAKKIILIANGKNKADICAKFIDDPETEEIAASALKHHRDVTVILNKDAASRLRR